MRRIFYLSLLLAAVLTRPAFAAATDAHSATVCHPFDQLDLAKLPNKVNPEDEGYDFQSLWNEWSRKLEGSPWPDPPQADASVRVVTHISYISNGPISKEVRAEKHHGVWRLASRTGRFAPRSMRNFHWAKWEVPAVSKQVSDQLDAILEDECLWSAPRFLANPLPLKTGDFGVFYHGPYTQFDVRLGQRQWGGTQNSWIVGIPGQLRNLLMSTAFGDFGYVNEGFEETRGTAEDFGLVEK